MEEIYIECRELRRIHKQYEDQISKIENLLLDKIKFDFFVLYQYSDGFVIVDREESHNAPLNSCISEIKKHGCLNFESYLKLCI